MPSGCSTKRGIGKEKYLEELLGCLGFLSVASVEEKVKRIGGLIRNSKRSEIKEKS